MSTQSILPSVYIQPARFGEERRRISYDTEGFFNAGSNMLFKWNVDLGKPFFEPRAESDEEREKRLEREKNSTDRVCIVPESTLALHGFLLHCIADYSCQYGSKRCPLYIDAYNRVIKEVVQLDRREKRKPVQLGFCIHAEYGYERAEIKECSVGHYTNSLLFYPLIKEGMLEGMNKRVTNDILAIRFFQIEFLFGLRFVKENSKFSNYTKHSATAILNAFHLWIGKPIQVNRRLAGKYIEDKDFHKLFLLWVCEVFNPLHPRSCYQDPLLAERYLLKPEQMKQVEERGGFIGLPVELEEERYKMFTARPERPKFKPSAWFASRDKGAKAASPEITEKVFSLFLEEIIRLRVESSTRDLNPWGEKREPNVFRLMEPYNKKRIKEEVRLLKMLEKREKMSEEEHKKALELKEERGKSHLIVETFMELDGEAKRGVNKTVTNSKGFNVPHNIRNGGRHYDTAEEMFRERLYRKFEKGIWSLVVTLQSLAPVCKQFYHITRKDSVFGPILFHSTLSSRFPGSGSVFNYCNSDEKAYIDRGAVTLKHHGFECTEGECDPTHWKLNCTRSNNVVRVLSNGPVFIERHEGLVKRELKRERMRLVSEGKRWRELEEACEDWESLLRRKIDWVGAFSRTFFAAARKKELVQLVTMREDVKNNERNAEKMIKKVLMGKKEGEELSNEERRIHAQYKRELEEATAELEEVEILHKKVMSYDKKVPRPKGTKIVRSGVAKGKRRLDVVIEEDEQLMRKRLKAESESVVFY